jgi:hypothetical protein
MRVYLAVQLLSNSVKEMMELCQLKKLVDQHQLYTRLIEMAAHVNNLVDICNGRKRKEWPDARYSKSTGPRIMKELLEILKWFSEWKALNDSTEGRDENHFIPVESWKDVQYLILSTISMIQYYCIDRDVVMVPRRIQSDKCEHHFASSRQCAGSSNSLTVTQMQTADANSTAVRSVRVKRGNSGQAPGDIEEITKRRKKF